MTGGKRENESINKQTETIITVALRVHNTDYNRKLHVEKKMIRVDLRDGIGVTQMGTGVHAEGTGTAAEAVTFGSELAGVAHAAEQLVLVLVGVGRVQHLVAQV